MSNITELEKKLEEAQELVNALQKEIEEAKAKPWQPTGGNYIVSSEGNFLEYGLCFENKAASDKAYKYYRFIHRLYKLAEELNKGWEPDWKNTESKKYFIEWSNETKDYTIDWWDTYSNLAPVFKDRETAKKAIEILKKEEKYWE